MTNTEKTALYRRVKLSISLTKQGFNFRRIEGCDIFEFSKDQRWALLSQDVKLPWVKSQMIVASGKSKHTGKSLFAIRFYQSN